MASRKQRNRALKHKKLNLDNLAPKIAAGITEGASAREALAEHPVVGKHDGASLTEHMTGEQPTLEGTRIPNPRFVARDDTHSVWHDEPTGRLQRNAVLAMDKATFQAIQSGHICLRCLEPQPEAFPDQCDLCGYPMHERQVMDIAMEFRGDDHVGPGAPIAEYLHEQDERLEKLDKEKAKREGSSPMRAVSRKVMSPGAKRLRGLSGRVHADAAVVEAAVKEKPDAQD